MELSRSERWLAILLRVSGTITLTAVVAVLMPRGWMAATHLWLNLGTFPEGPIVEYLARSLSAFYAMFGGMLIVVSFDVRRHARVIAYFAAVMIAFGATMCVIDTLIGMPSYWRTMEGIMPALFGVAILLLQRAVRRSDAKAPAAL
jgi:hypothetical protein